MVSIAVRCPDARVRLMAGVDGAEIVGWWMHANASTLGLLADQNSSSHVFMNKLFVQRGRNVKTKLGIRR